MSIETRIKLENLTENELPMLLNWRNKEVIRNVMMNSELISWNQHNQWFNNYQRNQSSQTKIFYFDNIPYGVLNIQGIDVENQKCEWGFYIGDEYSPLGMGSLLGYASLNYIFQDLGIRKLTAEVLSYNTKSIKFHEKFGFINEGRLRKHIIKNNQFIDIVIYGMFKEEWFSKRPEILETIEGRLI